MRLDNLTQDAVVELNIPTGVPLKYEMDPKALPLQHAYL
jgi:2,3-bisphosphoglycerate-dependent phosphoglycerate mutase